MSTSNQIHTSWKDLIFGAHVTFKVYPIWSIGYEKYVKSSVIYLHIKYAHNRQKIIFRIWFEIVKIGYRVD